MKRAKLHQEVAPHLGSIGYAPGTYGWCRAGRLLVLRILTKPDSKLSKAGGDLSSSCYVDLHLPTGRTTKAKLAAALATIPTIGSPKPVLLRSEASAPVQHDMRLQ